MKTGLLTLFGLFVMVGAGIGFAWMTVSAAETTFVARIYYDQVTDIEQLHHYAIDLHEYNNRAEKYVVAGMSSQTYDTLAADGWQVVRDDIASTAVNRTWDKRSAAPGTFYGGYRTVDTMMDIISSTAAAYPTITEKIDYGDSYCKLAGGCLYDGLTIDGYDLMAIRVGNKTNGIPSGDPDRPALILVASIHPRELTTAEQALFFLDHLVSNYGSDPDITTIIDWHDIYIIPVANPDGRYVVEVVNTPGSQRKNAHIEYDSCDAYGWSNNGPQHGVDLNRNHSFAWNTGGSEGWGCGQTYRGTAPASEPETASLEAFIESIVPDQRGDALTDAAPSDTQDILLSFHSYSDLVLYPWGNVLDDAPNAAGLKQISDKFGAMTGYISQRGIALYATSGTTDDWSYGTLGLPSFTFEIGSFSDGFFPPYSTVQTEHWDEVRDALVYAARIAATPYQQAQGPDVTVLTATLQAQTLTVSAALDDAQNGGQSINQAIMSFDAPIGVGSSIAYQMQLSGMVLDGTADTAALALDVCVLDMPPGERTIHVQGQDTDGNWGPVWTTAITIAPTVCNPVPLTLIYLPMIAQESVVVIAASTGLFASGLAVLTAFCMWRRKTVR